FFDLFPFPKQCYQISKCDTCPSNPSSLPTFQACLDHPMPHIPFHHPESIQCDPLLNHPIPNRLQMVHRSSPTMSVFTGISRAKSSYFQAPNLKTTTTTPPGASIRLITLVTCPSGSSALTWHLPPPCSPSASQLTGGSQPGLAQILAYTTRSPGKSLYTRGMKPGKMWNTTPTTSNPKPSCTKNKHKKQQHNET
ncbi:hypothetical protein JB92DRAFT_3016747, partial [Gautieria morchelliformis]